MPKREIASGKRHICFVITSFIHYSRNLLILEELRKAKDVDLSIVLGGSALLGKHASRYGGARELLEADGFKNIYEIYFSIEGDNTVAKAKTAGLGVVEFATLFNNLKPDLVMIRGDRYEVLSAALAASYMNLPIAHIEGGDVSGTIDENIRHAISKLSHIHFVTNADAGARLTRMGEDPRTIFHVGSPDIEVARMLAKGSLPLEVLAHTGSGAAFNPKERYVIVMYHPVWQDNGHARQTGHTRALLEAVHTLGLQVLWFWPNADLGAEDIAHELRKWNDTVEGHRIRFLRYLPPRLFLPLLASARCLIGNSSAGVKECSVLGIPAIDIGTRQSGRLKSTNVVVAEPTPRALAAAIKKQLAVGRYRPTTLYAKPHTAKRVARIAATTPLRLAKRFHDAPAPRTRRAKA